jgi:uncharacterized protein
MKSKKCSLPKQIEPLHLTELDTRLEGDLSLQQMPRLLELIEEKNGVVKVALRFTKNIEGKPIITGQTDTVLVVICQRCLEHMSLPMQVNVQLSPVFGDKADQLPDGYEPLVISAEPMELSEIIEDEILLNLPQFPKHDAENCSKTN